MSTPSPSSQDEHYVHPSIDRRVCVKAGVKVRKAPTVTATATAPAIETSSAASTPTNPTSRLFSKLFGNKKLESILARLDDPHINPQLVENMDESNPNIVLEFLLEIEQTHSDHQQSLRRRHHHHPEIFQRLSRSRLSGQFSEITRIENLQAFVGRGFAGRQTTATATADSAMLLVGELRSCLYPQRRLVESHSTVVQEKLLHRTISREENRLVNAEEDRLLE